MSEERNRTENNLDTLDQQIEPLEDIALVTNRERAVQIGSTSAALIGSASLAQSFIMTGHPIQVLANVGAISMAPVTIKKEIEITDVTALLEVNEKLSKENSAMKEEVARMRKTLVELENTTKKFEEDLDTLCFITKTQNFNVELFEEQVNQQKELLRLESKRKTAKLIQMFLSVVIRSDSNGDFRIDPNEVDNLMNNIDCVPGIIVNKKLFREKIISADGSLSAILNICRNLLDEENKEKVLDIAGE